MTVTNLHDERSRTSLHDTMKSRNRTYLYFVLQYMKACEGVFAAGDIAHFPLKLLGWEKVSIGHWQISHKHGKFFLKMLKMSVTE